MWVVSHLDLLFTTDRARWSGISYLVCLSQVYVSLTCWDFNSFDVSWMFCTSRLQLDNEHIKFAWYWRQSCRERAQSRSLRFMRLSCRLPTSRISCSQLDQRYVSVKSHRCGLACLLIPIPRPMTRTPAISIWPSVYHERSPARCSKKLNSCSHVCIIIIIFSRRWFAALEPNMSWLLIILSPSGIRIASHMLSPHWPSYKCTIEYPGYSRFSQHHGIYTRSTWAGVHPKKMTERRDVMID